MKKKWLAVGLVVIVLVVVINGSQYLISNESFKEVVNCSYLK